MAEATKYTLRRCSHAYDKNEGDTFSVLEKCTGVAKFDAILSVV